MPCQFNNQPVEQTSALGGSSLPGIKEVRPSAQHQWTVVVRDEMRERLDTIARMVQARAGARPVEASLDLDPRQLDVGKSVVLVAVEKALMSNAPILDWISRCKGAGLTIIAYEDDVTAWPLISKCLPLVAGAVKLLDSSRTEFASELGRLLQDVLDAMTGKDREEEAIHTLMRDHGI